jgi:branched-chain amino acid transport system substrate-binding protein
MINKIRCKLKEALTFVAATVLIAGASAMTPALAKEPGVTKTEVKVGMHTDLSGPLTAWGVHERAGMKMAFEEVNASGGIYGRTITLIVEDSGYDPKKAVLATQKLLNRDKVFAFVGNLGTPLVVATAPLIVRKGRPHLYPFTAARQTYEPFHKLMFANFTPYYHSTRIALRRMVAETGHKKIGILYQDDDYGVNVLEGVEDEVEQLGVELVAVTTFKRGATDFSAQIARMRADGVELVVLGTIVRETIGAMAAANSMDWHPVFLGALPTYTLETAKIGGDAVEGLFSVGQYPIPSKDDPNAEVAAWAAKFEETYAMEASSQSVIAYVTGRYFAENLRQAGPDLTADSLVKAIEDMAPWVDPTIGGAPIDFTSEDHLGSRSGFIAQVEGGVWKTVSEVFEFTEGDMEE